LRLGTDGDGALVALDHHTKTMSSTFDDFFEPASNVSQTLYACTAIATSHEGVRADIGTPLFLRAPGEAPGSIALESAIDEMAQAKRCEAEIAEYLDPRWAIRKRHVAAARQARGRL
jgi:xanthine dehydrogenase YagR molybdenum-binding subunit